MNEQTNDNPPSRWNRLVDGQRASCAFSSRNSQSSCSSVCVEKEAGNGIALAVDLAVPRNPLLLDGFFRCCACPLVPQCTFATLHHAVSWEQQRTNPAAPFRIVKSGSMSTRTRGMCHPFQETSTTNRVTSSYTITLHSQYYTILEGKKRKSISRIMLLMKIGRKSLSNARCLERIDGQRSGITLAAVVVA